jgi:predicted nucleic acid-binding protein
MKHVYFDTSVLVSLFVDDAHTARAVAMVRTTAPLPVLSDFAAAEFASALGVRVRREILTEAEASEVFSEFDLWRERAVPFNTTSADITRAEAWLRRLDLALRTPDALHLALARRCGAPIATFDVRMAEVAERLSLELVSV